MLGYVLKKFKQLDHKKICVVVMFAAAAILYYYMVNGYLGRHICTVRGSFGGVSFLFVLVVFFIYKRIEGTYIYIIDQIWMQAVISAIVPLGAILIEEITWNTKLLNIKPSSFLLNYTLVLLIEIGILLIFNRPSVIYGGILTVFWVYGIINHYVTEFRGKPPMPGDITALNTAASVMGQYKYNLSDSVLSGTFLFLFLMILLFFFPVSSIKTHRKKADLILVGGGILEILLLIAFLTIYSVGELFNIKINAWLPNASYMENGAPLSFLVSLQNMKVKKPQGYSVEKVNDILNGYHNAELQADGIMPTVICIMNESFSDLKVLGTLETDEYLHNLNNMSGYLLKGYTYASVLGGGTCNSEFEFLTGNTMAHLPEGIYPYQQYDLSNTYNIVQTFSDYGYATLAIHPYGKAGWNREFIYEQWGFDDFIALENMKDVEYIRKFPSDAYNYKQVISAYENCTKPLFLFNVTVQNHGGYDDIDALLGAIEPISIENRFQRFLDVVTYLTLDRESDNAFAELIQYFESVDDPVVICMFGDHQPALDSDFVEEMLGSINDVETAERRYMTPYIIWANYDLGVETEQNLDMSVNYLGAHLLQLLGIQNEYTGYLLNLAKEIPVINTVGYQTADGNWHELEEESEYLSEYKIVEYYELFEKNKSY